MNKVRLVLFLLFSTVAPITYLIVRFHLFQTTTKLQVGLAGIVVIGIMIGIISVLIKFYLEGMKTKYSLTKQILQGIIKLILPLTLLLVSLIWLGDNIDMIKEALYIIIPCELVAIIINPLPKWCFDNNIEGLSEIADKILSKNKESKE